MAALTQNMTDEEFMRHAFSLIGQELGAGGLARFIRLNSVHRGNYTEERRDWQKNLKRESVLEGIRKLQSTR